jgi:hypothetical protein
VILRARPGLREAVLVKAFEPVITCKPSVLAACSRRAAAMPTPVVRTIQR